MNTEKNAKNYANNTPAEKGDRFGLWVGLGAAALTALGVIGLAIYTDYQENQKTESASGVAVVSEQAPSSIPVNETQAASIAANTSNIQSQGMTAPSDVGDDDTVAASSTAKAILAADGVQQEQSKVEVDGDVVRFYFATGKADVTANTLESLKGIVNGVKAGKKAVILTYSNVESNENLARDRALAVRSVLLAAGIPDGSIQVSNPTAETNDSRRVEVVLR